MSKRLLNLLLIITLLVAAVFVYQGAAPVSGQDPTIPTRTPTPDPNAPPTATPDDGDPPPPGATDTPGSELGATATSTTQPIDGSTATATTAADETPAAGITPGGTPGEGIITGEIGLPGCDDTPIVQAIDLMNVYGGPGGDYPIIGTMAQGETRLILGRAEFADWWYIQFDLTTTVWVDDEDVNEYGNTGSVPLAEPPPINGNTPTPGPIWMPTPLPACTTTPTATPTETPTSTPTVTATVVGVQASNAEPTQENGAVAAAGETPNVVTAPAPITPYVLPAVGAGLLGLGLVVGLLARRNNRATPDGDDETTV